MELINKPLDMSQQVEDDDGGGDLDDGFQPGLQVSQGGQKPAVMQPDSSNVPMVFRPKLENIHQSPPRSQPETSMSPPRSDIEQRCSFHSVPFSHHYLKHHHHHNHIRHHDQHQNGKNAGARILRREASHLPLLQGCPPSLPGELITMSRGKMGLFLSFIMISIPGQKLRRTRKSFLPRSTDPPLLHHLPPPRPHPPSPTFAPLHPTLDCTTHPCQMMLRYVFARFIPNLNWLLS